MRVLQSLSSALLLSFLLTSPALAQGGSPPGYSWIENPANGHWYALSTPGTWHDAEAEAVALGGHLATVRSQTEDQWLISEFFDEYCGVSTVDDTGAWIGFSDEASEGTFVWVSGEPVTYSGWFVGEPSGSLDEDFVCYYSNQGSTGWADLSLSNGNYCGSDLPGIMEVIPGSGNMSLRLDGVNDAVVIPDDPAFQDIRTVEAWVLLRGDGSGNPLSGVKRAAIVGDSDGGIVGSTQRYSVEMLLEPTLSTNTGPYNGRATWINEQGTPTSAQLRTASTLAYDTWYHLATTWDGQTQRLYLDGIQVDEFPYSGIGIHDWNHDFVIGALLWSGQWIQELDGEIDELRFWSSTRTAQEIADNRFFSMTNHSDLVASWTFDGDFADSVGGHHGNPIGDATFAFPGAPISPIQLSVPLLIRGQLVTLIADGVRKDSRVHFCFSLAGPGPLQTSYGFSLDLTPPIEILGSAVATHAGSVGISTTIPPTAPPGLQVWLQAVEAIGKPPTSFLVSNMVATTIQ